MKKIQLTLFVVCFCIIANAQYLKMPLDTNHCWRQDFYSAYSFPEQAEYNATYQLRVIRDTLISGTSYHILKKNTVSHSSSTGNGSLYSPGYFPSAVFYIKQDTAQKIVIVLDANNQEKILYNFNKNVGDTANLFIGNSVRTMTLQTKDSLFLNDGIYHKRFHFLDGSGYYGGYVIEGVGALTGLVTPCFVGIEFVDHIVCMAKINPTIQTIYHQNGIGYSCSIVTSIKPNELLINTFTIFPNPTNSLLTLQTDEEITSITIYNTIGETCSFKPLSAKSIDISGLSSGVYYLEVKTAKGLAHKKFVKE